MSLDVRRARQEGRDGHPRDEPDVVDHRDVAWVCHGDFKYPVFLTERKNDVPPGKSLGDFVRHVCVDLTVLEVGDLDLEVTAEYFGEAILLDRALADEDGPERRLRDPLRGKRTRELLLRDHRVGDQDLAELRFGRLRLAGSIRY